MLVVTGIGSATYDVAACGDHPLNFYLWSAMGSTAMVGLGLALARPDRRVAVITGDGDMLMGLGSLATIGVKQPDNLADRRARQPATTAPPACSRATPLRASISPARRRPASSRGSSGCRTIDSAAEMRALLHTGQGPIFIHAQVEADDQKRIIPSRDGYAHQAALHAGVGEAGL